MKILIASDLYWPVINGVSTFSRNLAIGLADRGHEVIVIAPSQTGKKHVEVDGKYKIHRTATVTFPFYQKYRISLAPYLEVRKIIKNFRPDVIHIQMPLMIGQATMRAGTKRRIPIVGTNHAIPENLLDNLRLIAPVSAQINKALKRLGMNFYSKADYLTMPTQAAIDMFPEEVKKVGKKIVPISNGIDLSRFMPIDASKEIYKKYNLPHDKPIIYYVGRVDGEKHISVLVHAFNRILHNQDAHLMIVGDGTDMPVLKDLVNVLEIEDNVTFTGRVSDEDLVQLYRAGDVLCMPSPAELQSIVMLEAMASGKPVVAVDAGALKELCQNERNGYLCAKDDVDCIARSLAKIISDKKLSESMGQESLAIAATHDLQNTISTFEKIYQDLAK